jgi:acetoin utilization deacetylase AcuC-like enzyme
VGSVAYFETLDKALSCINPGDYEQMAVSAGFDTHSCDLASLGLVTEDYYQIGKRIAKMGFTDLFCTGRRLQWTKRWVRYRYFLRGYEENR